MNHHCLPASFRHSAIAIAASTLWLLPAPASRAAEPGPIGAEFQVNTLTTGSQRLPAIALDADGDFVVAWQSEVSGSYEIRAQRYNAAGLAQGAEFQVNTLTTGGQRFPAIALDADGDFIVAWQSDVSGSDEIRAQHYDAAGLAQGPEFQVNFLTTGTQSSPAIALDADGGFVVAWTSNSSGSLEIRARRYDERGVGAEFQVNTLTTDSQTSPAIALDADGDFVVAWQSVVSGSYEIRAQRYNAFGFAQGAEFQVNTLTTSSQFRPAIALDADGDFVVAWQSDATSSSEIRAQRYNASGAAQGTEFQVNTLTTGIQSFPAIALDADGDFVVAWQSDVSGSEIRARRYNAAGLPQGAEFQVNTLTNFHLSPTIALDADGDFVVAWESTYSGNFDIRARRYQGSDPVDADLIQADSADPAPVGSPLTYTLIAGNLQTPQTPTGLAVIDNALGTATGLRLFDTLPSGATAISATGTNWVCALPAGKVNCLYSLKVPAGEDASPLTIRLTPPNTPGALIRNIGRVSTDQFDDDLLNNRDVETTQLVCAESVIQLSASDYSVAENIASATITASRSGGACGVATVQFDTTGSSATPGLDFTDVTGTLTWADGELGNKTFTVPILNDGLDEINERVLINLSNAQGARFGAGNAARLTITDDDATPRVNFKTAAQSTSETPNLITVTARLGGLSGRNVTIPLTFTGTAGNGSDYFPAITSITIPAGQFESSADIEIAGDSADEADETIIVGMGALTGATAGSINTHTITITDNDAPPTVSFDLATASLNEATPNTVQVNLSTASAKTVTVSYTGTGTATFTTDYSLSLPSPISFSPGQIEKTIVITPVDDAVDEPNENLVLTLGTPTNATLGAGVSHRRTIVDNDP